MTSDMKMATLKGLDTKWMSDAKCKNENTSSFFEEFERGSGIFKNKMVFFCGSCPVAQDCYQYAIDAGETGLWGGAYFSTGKPRNPFRARYLEKDRDRAATQRAS